MNTDRTRPKSVSPTFGSLSPTHHYSPPLRTKRLPKVIEGHFTTALTDRLGRVRLGGHSEEMTWPPDRGKKGKDPVLFPPYHIDSELHPFNQPVAGPSKLTTAAGPSSLTSSTELPHGQPVVVPSATPMSKESARLLNAPPLAQISTESASSTMADEAASGEEDEESNHDIKEAEEESVVEKLVSGSPLEGLQDQDDPECDAENEPELAPDDAEQLDEDDRHHNFSLQERPPAIRIERESLIPPSLYGPLGDSAQVLNSVSLDVCRTRSVSPSWNANEGITLLSSNGRMHQMLERRLGKHGMKKRVAQLLR
ncbi:hypothetical protein BD769DRAFT_524898 [Suillus cothurnatus]|nr:hypothetical protein BD769DRAFT_524898 [Suillus cothurnatus]